MERQVNPPLAPEVWERVPEEARALILAMQTHLRQLDSRVKELEARLGQTSRNSSRPPSTDPPGTARPKGKPGPGRGNRKRGAQPGHPGRHRTRYARREVTEVVELHPQRCRHCGLGLAGAAREGKVWRHQVVELPQVHATITEYRRHSRRCNGCGCRTRADLPAGAARRCWGPRLQATAVLLTGRYRLSRREARQLLQDLWGVELSLGGLSQLEGATAEVLAPVVAEAAQTIERAGAVNVDETGWREENRRSWLWTAVTQDVSLFRIEASRRGAVVEQLLGKGFSGVAGTDRYSAYDRIPLEQRALCHAHLKRNFQALVDRGGEGAKVGNWGLRELGRLFALWRRLRRGEIDRLGLQQGLKPIKARFGKLLEYGLWGEDHQAETLCWQLKQQWAALWTFARVEGVEPTNNAAERALRPGVLWRKGSFGSQSDRGSRFAERMLSVAASCRQQGRNLLDLLTAACRAVWLGVPTPSLVAQPHPPS